MQGVAKKNISILITFEGITRWDHQPLRLPNINPSCTLLCADNDLKVILFMLTLTDFRMLGQLSYITHTRCYLNWHQIYENQINDIPCVGIHVYQVVLKLNHCLWTLNLLLYFFMSDCMSVTLQLPF